MEVTRVNFSRVLPLIKDTIAWCDFVALDVEFTGLGLSRVSQLDTPERRYFHARESAEEYPPCQVGLALFGQNKDKKEWEVVVINIYVCARAVFGGGRTNRRYPIVDRVWKVQASSVEFLRTSGFNFVKWMKDGVDWLRRDVENDIREILEEDAMKVFSSKKGKYSDEDGITRMNEEDKKFIGQVEKKVRKWLKGRDKKFTLDEADSSRFRRNLVYEMIENNFPSVGIEEYIDSKQGSRWFYLEKYSTEMEAKKRNLEWKEKYRKDFVQRSLNKHIGARQVIDLLVQSKKPILLHNCLLDLTKIIANFIGPLPDTLVGFKSLVQSTFCTLFDTKHMSNSLAAAIPWFKAALRSVRGTSLIEQHFMLKKHHKVGDIPVSQFPLVPGEDAYASDCYVEYPEDQSVYGENKDSRNAHDAGFDAYTTGRFFLQLLKIMGFDKKINFAAEQLEKLSNKVSVQSCGGYTHIDLTPGTVERNIYIDRDDVLVIDGIKPKNKDEKLDSQYYASVIRHLLKGTGFKYDRKVIIPGCILLVLEPKTERKAVHSETERQSSHIDCAISPCTTNRDVQSLEADRVKQIEMIETEPVEASQAQPVKASRVVMPDMTKAQVIESNQAQPAETANVQLIEMEQVHAVDGLEETCTVENDSQPTGTRQKAVGDIELTGNDDLCPETRTVVAPELRDRVLSGRATKGEYKNAGKSFQQQKKWLAKIYARAKTLRLQVLTYGEVMRNRPDERTEDERYSRKRQRIV